MPCVDLDELSQRSAMPEVAWDQLASRPAIVPWRELRRNFIDVVARDFSRWISPDQVHFRDQLLVAAGRFDQGVRLITDLVPITAGQPKLRVLDVGSGNGGVSIAFANDPRHVVYAVDIVANAHAMALRQELAVPFRQVVADGVALPFASESIDLVLLIDVLEHLSSARAVGAEIMRVLSPTGRCIVLTPARVPLLFRRDPHYRIAGLLCFPNETQRFIVNRLFRRRIQTPSGESRDAYDVEHTFWHAHEVAGIFPGDKTVDVLYDQSFRPPPGNWNWRWIRRPSWAFERVRYDLRRFFFGHIIVHKGMAASGTPSYDRFTSCRSERISFPSRERSAVQS